MDGQLDQQEEGEELQQDEKATGDKFTTLDFIDKIKETLMLAGEISRVPAVKENPKIGKLLAMQSRNCLQL